MTSPTPAPAPVPVTPDGWLDRLSVRFRVAALMALGIMLALGLYSALGWKSVSTLLLNDLNRDVTQFTAEATHAITEARTVQDLRALRLTFPGYEVHSRALGPAGEVYLFSAFPDEMNTWPFSRDIQSHGDWRTLQVPVVWQGRTLTVQTALRSPEMVAGIRAHRNRMVSTALLLMLLGGGTAFLLSLYVLRPLEDLTRVSSRIAASGRLEEEVAVPRGAGREITALALSFNQMLGRLREFRSREATFNRQASHELRTPLTAMRLSLDAAQAGYAEPGETLDVLDQELRRTQSLTSSLLILSREGRLAQVETVDVARLARECAAHCGAAYQGLDRALVHGDGTLLRRALENLLENAARYAPDALVQVGVHPHARGVTVTVQDWGPGLPDSELPRLTEEFYRVDRHRRDGSGAGLGLSVVRHVMQAHGGEVLIEPVLPHGLKVTLAFPDATDLT